MDKLQKQNEVKNPILFNIDKDELLTSPVTVVNGEIMENGDINGLFTTAYDAKLVSNAASDIAMKQFGYTDEKNEHNRYIDKEYRTYNSARYASGIDVINNYIIMNITDLTYNTLLTFINNKFDAKLKNVGIYFSDEFLNGIDIRQTLEGYINYYNRIPLYTLDRKSQNDAGLVYILSNQMMDAIYGILVNSVFDKYIENIVTFSFKSNSIEALYKVLYQEVYKEETKVTPDVQTCYTFCTSILREEMDKCCMEFKLALTAIAKNVAIQCNNILYTDNINSKLSPVLGSFLPEK